MVKQAVEAYGEYEQLVGGVETLFGDAAQTVQENAANAFRTAQMSANDYMQTATSFAASLVQSLGRGEQTNLDELEETLSDEYNAAKKSYSAQYTARKNALDQQIAAVKSAYDEEISLISRKDKKSIASAKAARDEEIAALKAAKETELDALKATNEKNLAELKKANKAQLAEAERQNMVSTTTADVQQRAADIADIAMKDMADNANKMGTSMQRIQDAYAGLARGEYMMLDNLRLGYKGTKTEMERLIADANDIRRANGETADLSVNSFADMVMAIHAVQENMGITGTTALEASETIQGSINAAKAAYSNLIVGLADDNADLDKLFDNLIDTGKAAYNNVAPRVKTLVKRVVAEVKKLYPSIKAEFVKIIKQNDTTIAKIGGIGIAFKSLIKGNWWGVAAGGIIAAAGLVNDALDKSRDKIRGLSEADRKYIDRANALADTLSNTLAARNSNIASIETETEYTKLLWRELQTLADENGNVEEKNRSRAEYILGELNNALGTEYSLNEGIIDQYGKMRTEIDKLIVKKRAERLLESSSEAYDTAKSNLSSYLSAAQVSADSLTKAQAALDKALKEETPQQKRLRMGGMYGGAVYEAQQAVKAAQAEYDKNAAAAKDAAQVIDAFEKAMIASSQENYNEVAQILEKDTAYRWQHTKDITQATADEIKQLREDYKRAYDAAKFYGEQLDNNIEGFAQEQLDELEKKAQTMKDLLDEYKRAHTSTLPNAATAASGAFPGLGVSQDAIEKAIRGALQNVDIRLDSGALVGGIAPKMDNALGNRYRASNREVLVN